ncbi:MAG: STAS-like domain-containing protein [Spirochaetaceae bacterium]|nr:STAS-like domain-containing protein [Spirochaetaceae bacterium]
MNLEINKFGEVLMSRPAGKEAFSMAKAYIFPMLQPDEKIELDFAGVKVLAPSWADEFITGIKNSFSNEIKFLNTDNESVEASLNTVLKIT